MFCFRACDQREFDELLQILCDSDEDLQEDTGHSTRSACPSSSELLNCALPPLPKYTFSNINTSRLMSALDLAMPGVYQRPVCWDDPIGCDFKYDMTWQKRSTGRKYDSMSGVGLLFGKNSGKVTQFSVMITRCKMCDIYEGKGSNPPSHLCVRNWHGSSKAMEPAAALACIRSVEEQGCTVEGLIMDDDCTTISHLRKSLPHSIEKYSDIAHAKKHIASVLYPVVNCYKELNGDVIRGLQNMFVSALKQNKGNVENVRAAILNIVPHVFGEHDKCGAWCKGKHDPNYKHRLLPEGKNLSEVSLRGFLMETFSLIAKKAEALSPAESTSVVESTNNMISTKNPKRLHLSFTEQVRTRTAAAVLQKNEGQVYVQTVNEKLLLSPGKQRKKVATNLDIARRYDRRRRKDPNERRKRIQRAFFKTAAGKAREVREGITYKSNIGFEENVTIHDTIPAPVVNDFSEKVGEAKCSSPIVYFDLETSSRSSKCDILQLAARHEDSQFNVYITPDCQSISADATRLHGLKMKQGKLHHNDVIVETVTFSEGCKQFISWLNTLTEKKVILAAHNARPFDARRLLAQISRQEEKESLLNSLDNVCEGFLDTLPLCRKLFPQLKSHSLGNLVSSILECNFNAHNAIDDVEMLSRVFKIAEGDVQKMELSKFTVSLKWLHKDMTLTADASERVQSFNEMVAKKHISAAMAQKAAKSGLTIDHFRSAIRFKGKEGIRSLLGEPVSGKPRVTTNRSVLNKVFTYFQEHERVSSSI